MNRSSLPLALTLVAICCFAAMGVMVVGVVGIRRIPLPPSSLSSASNKTPYKSNAEEFSGQNSTPSGFQLITGQTWVASKTSAAATTFNIPVILKLDTKTGAAWLLVIVDSTNGTQTGFTLLPNLATP